MDIALSILAGLVLRLLPTSTSIAALLGIWEGGVAHQLAGRSTAPVLDHSLAYGLRLAVDLLIHKDLRRLALVIVCSIVGALASEAATPYATLRSERRRTKDRREKRHRSSRTISGSANTTFNGVPIISTPLPPRVRAYHHPTEPTFTETSSAIPPIVVTQDPSTIHTSTPTPTDTTPPTRGGPASTTLTPTSTSDPVSATTTSPHFPTIPPPTPPSIFLQENTELLDDPSPEAKPIQILASTTVHESGSTDPVSGTVTPIDDSALPVRPRTALASVLEDDMDKSSASPPNPFHNPDSASPPNILPTPPESGGDRSGPSAVDFQNDHSTASAHQQPIPGSQRLSTIEEMSGDDDPCLPAASGHLDPEHDLEYIPPIPPISGTTSLTFGTAPPLPVPNAGLRFGGPARWSISNNTKRPQSDPFLDSFSNSNPFPIPVPVPVRKTQLEESLAKDDGSLPGAWGTDTLPPDHRYDPNFPIPGTPDLNSADDGVLELEIGNGDGGNDADESDPDPLLTPGNRKHLEQETDHEYDGRDELQTPIQSRPKELDLGIEGAAPPGGGYGFGFGYESAGPSSGGQNDNGNGDEAGLLSPLPLNVRSNLHSEDEFLRQEQEDRERSTTPVEIPPHVIATPSNQGSISRNTLLQPPPERKAPSPPPEPQPQPEPQPALAPEAAPVVMDSARVPPVQPSGKRRKKKNAQNASATAPAPPPPPPPPPREPTPPPPSDPTPPPSPPSPSASSDLSTKVPSKLYLRGDELRASARLLEQERTLIEMERKKAENERRVGDALRLKIRLREVDRDVARLHERAARRYYVARNAMGMGASGSGGGGGSGGAGASGGVTAMKAKIDVHGLRSREAFERVELALLEVIRLGKDTLRVIVGKGLHSVNGQPVLKNTVQREMLRQGFKCEVDTRNPGILVITVPKPGSSS